MIQFVEVQHLLRHDRDSVDRRACCRWAGGEEDEGR
ncbi:unnamed protein product [Protopolystoma xenopodis]|uniref:Uncharacterized protein n=1 Tax=Protopolystoma xenopodis TaxID=117903 RepID=A0A3S5AJJ9_9PLAT|nr:unnamed protein product [Protopolystoma xenopodis]